MMVMTNNPEATGSKPVGGTPERKPLLFFTPLLLKIFLSSLPLPLPTYSSTSTFFPLYLLTNIPPSIFSSTTSFPSLFSFDAAAILVDFILFFFFLLLFLFQFFLPLSFIYSSLDYHSDQSVIRLNESTHCYEYYL
jgi:hypothetical protein